MDAREQLEAVIAFLKSSAAGEMGQSAVERTIQQRSTDIMRLLLQGFIDSFGSGEAAEPVVGRSGVEHRQQRMHTRALESTFGTVSVSRSGYPGDGLESLHPLDGRLNLPPELYSHELQRQVVQEVSKGSFEEAIHSVAGRTKGEMPKRQARESVIRAAQDFETFYAQRTAQAAEAGAGSAVVVLSTDGKGVPMRFEDLREQTRKAAAGKPRHKLKGRRSKGEKRHRKRMATVAVVYTVDRFVRTPEQVIEECARAQKDAAQRKPRPRPENKRVWASLEKEAKEVVGQAFEEAQRRDPHQQRQWVGVVDGNKPQLGYLRKGARALGVALTIVLDIVHVREYLWKAGLCFHQEGSAELEQWVNRRCLEVLRGRAGSVAGGMRRSATLRNLDPKQRAAVDVCARYFRSNARYMHYDRYLAQGLPIASGAVEGACGHLVKDRMEITGARWGLPTAEAVLRLRALRSSGDFDEYWQFHEAQERERNHAQRYANGRVPEIRVPTELRHPTHLKAVK